MLWSCRECKIPRTGHTLWYWKCVTRGEFDWRRQQHATVQQDEDLVLMLEKSWIWRAALRRINEQLALGQKMDDYARRSVCNNRMKKDLQRNTDQIKDSGTPIARSSVASGILWRWYQDKEGHMEQATAVQWKAFIKTFLHMNTKKERQRDDSKPEDHGRDIRANLVEG